MRRPCGTRGPDDHAFHVGGTVGQTANLQIGAHWKLPRCAALLRPR